ncbi:Zn-finger in ubiquitin-hydrolases and other protein [Tritrichomonas foetus]|uniref:Zn-finger in ubiquitin-hydrolases and other protein n=1 Tax=Tritrichomonas foetus TaxID=1144522 RepID=A0A1J4KEH6_9EUKA|nr:Zn-finger in ubiquitin-hydrolases and other protein [Tritrichomonas foetus]|eukprot:OHT09825.1 Zn-finger in ubiquitin-hydrolases and other protein [Tritrichomonas foetus]
MPYKIISQKVSRNLLFISKKKKKKKKSSTMFAIDILATHKLQPNEISDDGFSFTCIDVPDMKLWKLLTTVSAHLTWDFPVLHPSRSNVVLILAIPSFLTYTDICKYVSRVTQTKNKVKFKITFLKCMFRCAIVEFEIQEGADTFYINTLGEPFDSTHLHIRCISLFLLEVTPEIGVHPIPTHEANCTREFPLPFCPLCFQLFDPLISTFFSPSTADDISITAFSEWGESQCPVCRVIHNTGNGKCDGCDETRRLWVCMECGHIGCGRDQNQHAILHYEKTHHRFSFRYDDRWLWDYQADRSVDRSFHDRPTDASDDVVLGYRKLLLEGVTSVRNHSEMEMEELHRKKQPEIDSLLKELEKLDEEEAKIDPEYQKVVNLDKQIEEIQKEINQVKNDPVMQQSDELKKKNIKLKKQLNQMKLRFDELCNVLEQRHDVTGDVVIDLQ